MERTATRVVRDGRIVLWEGASLWVFDVLPQVPTARNRMHSHHAFQVTLSAGGTASIWTGEGLIKGPLILVAPDVPHALEAEGRIAHLFVEPEGRFGAGLRRLLDGQAVVRLPEMTVVVTALAQVWANPPASDQDLARIGAGILAQLLGPREHDEALDPRIARVIEWIARATDDGSTAVEAARVACLSESRFSHLFVEATGLPFQTYVLWRRLMRAVEQAAAGESLTVAAHNAGFADSAHFSRTFQRMFGLPATTIDLVRRQR